MRRTFRIFIHIFERFLSLVAAVANTICRASRKFGLAPATRGRTGLTFSLKRSVSKQSKSFSFIGSRRGFATNDTLFCRHPAGDKDRGLKINCKTKNKQSKKHDAGQGIDWGARRGGMDATARGGARISATPRFSGLWFWPGKRKATARLRLVCVFFPTFFCHLFFWVETNIRVILGERLCERCV